jgi:hypothetical protein
MASVQHNIDDVEAKMQPLSDEINAVMRDGNEG